MMRGGLTVKHQKYDYPRKKELNPIPELWGPMDPKHFKIVTK